MKYLQLIALVLIISGCSITQVIDPYGEEVKLVCGETDNNSSLALTLNDETKSVNIHKTDNPDQIYDWCNGDGNLTAALGCTQGNDIYIPTGPTCYAIAAHELGHVFSVPGLDRPSIGQRQ